MRVPFKSGYTITSYRCIRDSPCRLFHLLAKEATGADSYNFVTNLGKSGMVGWGQIGIVLWTILQSSSSDFVKNKQKYVAIQEQ